MCWARGGLRGVERLSSRRTAHVTLKRHDHAIRFRPLVVLAEEVARLIHGQASIEVRTRVKLGEKMHAERQWRRGKSAVTVVALLVGFYFHVLLRVRPEAFYQQSPGLFLLDESFWVACLREPGGVVDCASAFLSPFCEVGWLGALAITLLASLIGLGTHRVLVAMSPTSSPVLSLVPVLLILILLGQYHHPLRLLVGLCLVLGLASAYVSTGSWHWALGLTALAFVSAVAYWTAGGLYVVLALVCGVFEWRVQRRGWLGTACVLSAVAVPLAAGAWLCDLTIEDAYRGLLLPSERYWLAVPSSALKSQAIRAALLSFFPIAAVAMAWRRGAADLSIPARAPLPAESNRDAPLAAGRSTSVQRLAVPSAVLILLAIAADVLLFDAERKHLLLAAYRAEREQWSEVLAHAPHLPPTNPWTAFQVHRALYHRGELLERMFAYPQVADSVPRLTLQFESLTITAQRVPLESSDLFFELGRINESQHMAYEALEMFGERPRTLQRLFYLHAIKGEPDAARRFLAVLERSLSHRRWAREYLQRLDADPTLADVPAIASRRELMVEQDFTGTLDTETMLGQLLQRNPRNRMALEYLMAYYLLTRRIDRVAANARRFDDLGQGRLPRHCEEAILIYLKAAGPRALDLGKRQICPETRRRGEEFARAASRVQGDMSEAFKALYPEFGDSYFFFYVFGRNDPRLEPARPLR